MQPAEWSKKIPHKVENITGYRRFMSKDGITMFVRVWVKLDLQRKNEADKLNHLLDLATSDHHKKLLHF